MKSVFSPYSELPIPQGEELPNGDFVPDFHLNNIINIEVDPGHHTVEEIEVAYRIGNEGNLYVFDRIKRADIKEVQTLSITGTIYKENRRRENPGNRMENIGHLGGAAITDLRVGMVLRSDYPIVGEYVDGLSIIDIDVARNEIYLSGFPQLPAGADSYNIGPGIVYITIEDYSVVFRNDTVDYAVPTEEAIESFDGVPLTSRAMEVIESNRIVVGGPKTGYDNVELNVAATVSHDNVSSYLSKFDFPIAYTYQGGNNKFLFVKFPESFNNNDYLFFNFLFKSKIDGSEHTVVATYLYKDTSDDTIEDIVAYIIERINVYAGTEPPLNFYLSTISATPYVYSAGAQTAYTYGMEVSYLSKIYRAKRASPIGRPSGTIEDNDNWDYLCDEVDKDKSMVMRSSILVSDYAPYNYALDTYGVSIYTGQQIYSIFKYGNRINVGLAYLDYAGRLGAVNITDQLAIDIPHLSSLDYHPDYHYAFSNNTVINSIELQIKNRPPDWAHAYRILIDRNIPWFFQFFFYGPAHADPDITDDNIHWKINVNQAIQNLRDYIPKATLAPYIFEKGDRLRLIAYKSQSNIDASTNTWIKFSDVMDVEIIGYDYPEASETSETYMKDDGDGTEGSKDYILDSNGNKIREISTGYIITEKFANEGITFDNSVYILYEIYRPRKVSDENTSYWETAKTFAIGNPGEEGRYHKGDTDQDPDNLSTTPAEITLNGGNVYRKMRYSGEADIYFPVESLSLSDYYESNAISIGRSNAVSEDLGQVDEENAYMWSDILLEDTAINRLNKFPSGNKDRLQSKHGAISAFKEKGFILYAWQTNKVTSIYIGRSSMVDPSDGSERVNLISKAVFGTVRPANSEYGCVDPKSISDSQVHVYFWDANNSKWCRIAYNGVFPISDYGMNKFYNDLNLLMKQTSNKHAISVYDNKNDELIVSHKYMATTDYTLSVVGQYTIGDNKLTSIGRSGGDVIASLEEGMILTQLSSSETTPEINVSILKIDAPGRIIYLDQVIPFATGITGPVEINAQIIKKNVYTTIAFHEPVNGWKTRYPFPPELMVAYGDQMLSFLNGKVYIHNSDNVPYNFFYGIQFEQYFQFVFNADVSVVKILEGIEYIATKKFGAIAKGDITVKSFDARGMDMESKLPAAKFTNVEGKWVSELLRDMNTPGIANENYALTDGRFLRGQACIIKLTTFETVKTVLFEVSIYFNQSL
jgi:hypothetical protein